MKQEKVYFICGSASNEVYFFASLDEVNCVLILKKMNILYLLISRNKGLCNPYRKWALDRSVL